MRDSVFFRRILALLIGAIFLAALLTLAFYYFVTSDIVYTNITANDLRKKASLLSDHSESYLLNETSQIEYDAILAVTADMLNASLHIHYFSDSIDNNSISPQGSDLDTTALADAERMVTNTFDLLRQGQSIQLREDLGINAIDSLIIAYPVEVFNRETGQRSIEAAIFLSRSMDNIRTGYDSLNFALILASGLSVLIMVFPTYFAISRMIRPLKQVKEVAVAMSNGNFSLRADTNQPGEIGELATAINELSSDLDRTIAALMRERNRLSQILDGLNEGIIAVDRNLRLTHTNPAAEKLLGEQENFSFSRDNEPEDREQIYYLSSSNQLDRDFQQAIDSGKVRSRSFQLYDRIILLSVSPLTNENDSIIGAVGLLRDVTASEKLEQTRRDYIANVSHELRTPLTAMRGLIEPLADGLVKNVNDQQRYYKIILDETLRLSRLIDDMLELSRLQAGKISLKRDAFEIWTLFRSLQFKYENVAHERGIHFSLPDFDPDCPMAYSNADRVEQVLVILIDNAIKFTPSGGIVEIEAAWESDRIILSVKDTGVGIAKEDLAHVFDRFYKSDKSRGQQAGTGLGLSIAREMVEQMGEKIWVRSRLDHGSSFYLSLTKYKD